MAAITRRRTGELLRELFKLLMRRPKACRPVQPWLHWRSV